MRVDIALRSEAEMLYLILLAFFVVQFLVIVGVLLFAIFFSRPEVPLKGKGGREGTAVDDSEKPTGRGKDASGDSHTPMNQLIAVQPPVFAAHPFPPCGGLDQRSVGMPS
jgi:hypothetical protein